MFNNLSEKIDKAENWFDGEENEEIGNKDEADKCIEIINNLIE